MHSIAQSIKNVRIYHESVDRIDNSVLRVTAWHQTVTRGTELSNVSTNACWILFLAYF